MINDVVWSESCRLILLHLIIKILSPDPDHPHFSPEPWAFAHPACTAVSCPHRHTLAPGKPPSPRQPVHSHRHPRALTRSSSHYRHARGIFWHHRWLTMRNPSYCARPESPDSAAPAARTPDPFQCRHRRSSWRPAWRNTTRPGRKAGRQRKGMNCAVGLRWFCGVMLPNGHCTARRVIIMSFSWPKFSAKGSVMV